MENDVIHSSHAKQKIDSVLSKLRDQQFRLVEKAFHELVALHLEGVSDEQLREKVQLRFHSDGEVYKQQVQGIALAYFNVLQRQMHVNEFHLLHEMYRKVYLLSKQANRGQQPEQIHLEAIAKILFPEQSCLSPRDIREFVERDYSDGKIDRAIHILSLENTLAYLVEPRRSNIGNDIRNPRVKIKLKDSPSFDSEFNELIQRFWMKVDFMTLREEAKAHLEDQSTLRSLAIKIYQQRLFNEGIDLHLETLERNVRAFEALKKKGKLDYLMSRYSLPDGTSIPVIHPNNSWVARAKKKRSTSK